MVAAQQPGTPQPGSPAPTATSEAAPAPETATQDPATDEPPVYGKLVIEKANLRCWASAVASPPQFEDVFEKDQVVQLGRSENGFRAVILPLGPIGYVSKRFTVAAEDGSVTTKGTKVAFRYRPVTSEAPVAQMKDGTTVHVIGEKDDWYRVRVEGVEAWLAAAEVQVVDADDAQVLAAHQTLSKKMQGEVQARLDAIAAEQAKAKQAAIDLEAVKAVEAAFKQEMDKPITDQVYPPLLSALDKVAGSFEKDSGAHTAVAGLRKRIETQQWIAEARQVTAADPPETNEPKVEKPVDDSLNRFESIGWLRYERRLAGPGVYYLEKGGRRQFELSCNTGRYDLSLFVGREVGVIGPRRSPITEAMSVLDIERIEVLGFK